MDLERCTKRPEGYFGPHQSSMMVSVCEKKKQDSAANYFHKNTLSWQGPKYASEGFVEGDLNITKERLFAYVQQAGQVRLLLLMLLHVNKPTWWITLWSHTSHIFSHTFPSINEKRLSLNISMLELRIFRKNPLMEIMA